MHRRIASALFALAGVLGAVEPRAAAFIAPYCLACHGPAVHTAAPPSARLQLPPADTDSLILVQAILDKLTSGAMPPPTARQPPAAERLRMIGALTRMAAESRAALT